MSMSCSADHERFPAKPKGMHWRRYNRLRHLHDQAVENSLATLQGYLTRLGGNWVDFVEGAAARELCRHGQRMGEARRPPGGAIIAHAGAPLPAAL